MKIVEGVDFSQLEHMSKDHSSQNKATYDSVISKISRDKLSINHTLDEIEEQNEPEARTESEESRQRPDGMWDCAHKCKNKQTYVSISFRPFHTKIYPPGVAICAVELALQRSLSEGNLQQVKAKINLPTKQSSPRV